MESIRHVESIKKPDKYKPLRERNLWADGAALGGEDESLDGDEEERGEGHEVATARIFPKIINVRYK